MSEKGGKIVNLNQFLFERLTEISQENNTKMRELKRLLHGKEPMLKFTCECDKVTVFVGASNSASCYMILGQLDIFRVLNQKAFSSFETVELWLLAVFTFDKITGMDNNPLRKGYYQEPDGGLNTLIKKHILSDETLCRQIKTAIFSKHCVAINFDYNDAEIVTALNTVAPWINDDCIIIKEKEYVVLIQRHTFIKCFIDKRKGMYSGLFETLDVHMGSLSDLEKYVGTLYIW